MWIWIVTAGIHIQVSDLFSHISVHRIGRTGRCGNRGTATTFINKGVGMSHYIYMIKLVTVLYLYILLTMLFSVAEESILLDLKHLLREAKQKIPPFLANMQSENEKYLDIGGKLSWQLTKKYVILIGRISRVVILDLLVVMMVSFGMCLLQARLAAPTVEAWDIVSQTVPNWRQSRQNRRRISVAVTTWPTAVRTTEWISRRCGSCREGDMSSQRLMDRRCEYKMTIGSRTLEVLQ